MNRSIQYLSLFPATCILMMLSTCVADKPGQTDWPSFRGKGAVGVANGFETAVEWDATNAEDKSVLWKSPVPGLGHSCPVVVGNQIFLATAVSSDNGDAQLKIGRSGGTAAADDNGEQSWMILCFDKTNGKELWRETAHTGIPKTTRHQKATHANSTLAIDGDNVVAFFGSEGLFCYDLHGKLKWKKSLGVVNISKYDIGWGYGSSPAIHDGKIILVCDDPNAPYVVALKLSDGEEIWRTSRQGDCVRSWGTPLIHDIQGGPRVVVNGCPWIVAYDLADGEEVWRISGGGDNPIPTPFLVEDRIYLTNAHGGKSPIIVLRADARGNPGEPGAEKDGLVWRKERGGSYMSTPVVVGDYLYLASSNGVFRCYHASTGEKMYEKRLPGEAYVVSSLVAANDKVYCTAENGTVYVLATGPDFKVIAQNPLGEPCLASPAISKGVMYFRTTHSLVAVGSRDESANLTPNSEK